MEAYGRGNFWPAVTATMSGLLRCTAMVMLLVATACTAPRPRFELPPAEYRKTGTVILRTVDDVRPVCRISTALACAFGITLVLPDPCQFLDEWFAGLLCHEIAHGLGGWKHEPG